jgi:prophage regulatory protein
LHKDSQKYRAATIFNSFRKNLMTAKFLKVSTFFFAKLFILKNKETGYVLHIPVIPGISRRNIKMNTPSPDSILRRPEVERLSGLSRSSIYQKIKDGTFPLPLRLTSRSVGWRASDIAKWISSLGEKS